MDQDLETVALVTRPTKSTQFYLFNLFGDYILPRGGCIWLNDLLYLLELLDVGERAARSTLSRMKQRGWFVTHREGRESQYILTAAGRAILEEGERRIFEAPHRGWDGRWRLVVYSLPEELRRERNDLRKKLAWLGFGNLAPGAWISPHNREDEVLEVARDLDVRDYVTLFHGGVSRPDEEIVAACWDLEALDAAYEAFVARYQPAYKALYAEMEAEGTLLLAPEACFQRRFWLTYDFQFFPRKDPNLPRRLLPAGWRGTAARQLLHDYRALLSAGMGDFLDERVGPCTDREDR